MRVSVIDEASERGGSLIAEVRTAMAGLEGDINRVRVMLHRAEGAGCTDAVDYQTLALARDVVRWAHVSVREAMLRAFRYRLDDAP